MVKKDFLTKFQVFLHNQIPDIVLKILRETGYDSPLAVETINSEVIRDLEKYINENEHFANFFNGSIYSSSKPFSFLPGHKALLLGLKKKCGEFEKCEQVDAEQPKNANQRCQDENERNGIGNNSVNVSADRSSQKQNDSDLSLNIRASASSNPDSPKENQSKPSFELIEQKLRAKVSQFIIKKKINCKFVENEDGSNNIEIDIGHIEKCKNSRGKNIIKCALRCVACEISIPCYYDTHWNISNYEAHLKRYHTKSQTVLDNDAEKGANSNHLKQTLDLTNGDLTNDDLTNDDPTSTNKAKTVTNNADKRISISANIEKKISDMLKFDNLNIYDN